MSYDELPPGSTPPRDSEDVASNTAQEPSGQDAPPAAPKRRTRSRAAGTAAASEPTLPETTVEPAAQKPRTRRKPKPAPDEQELPSAEAITPRADAAVAPPETPLPASSGRKRRERQVAPPKEVIAEPVSESATTDSQLSAPTAEEQVVAASPEPSTRSNRRRRSAVKSTPANLAADVAETPIVEPESDALSTAEAVVQSPTPPARALRSRRSRSRNSSTAADANTKGTPTVPLAEGEPNIASEFGTDLPDTLAEVPTPGQPERQNRRRRGTRGRRGATAESTERPAIEISTGPDTLGDEPLIDGDADATSPETELDSTSVSGRSRRRRSRRSIVRIETEPVVEEIEPKVYIAPVIDRTVGAHLISRNGIPEIHIDGVVYPPVLFFGNIEEPDNRAKVLSEVCRAAKAGIHIHSTLVELPCPALPQSAAFHTAVDRIKTLLEADPEGYVIPRLVFIPAKGWKRANPSEVPVYADDTPGDPSIASELFWSEAERSIQQLIEHIGTVDNLSSRVAGYHLERGEWFHPLALGYDRSPANREGFREWLKAKYKNNVVLLRAAWYDGEVQFSTVEIPTFSTRANPQRAFYEPRRERSIIDFHEYTSESTARRLIALATTVKRVAEHKVLVSVCYGYTFEFGHTFSGHLSLGLLQTSQAVDLICGPPSYRDRTPGGSAGIPAPIDSPPLHGKLWVSEDDTKTFLAPIAEEPDDFHVRLESRHATDQAQQRAIGRTVAHSTGIGFMDLWGEGWLDDDDIWTQLSTFVSRYKDQLAKKQFPRIPDVVALIDESSLLHVQRGESFLRRLGANLRDTLQRAGISFGIYLQSDLLADSFPTDAKLYLFMNPFRLSSEQQAAIKEKLQNNNKTLAWLYAPGSCEDRPSVGGALEETATGAIGIALRQQEWNSEVGSRVIDTHHALTERLPGRELGTKERLNPSFYVDDPDAVVVAEYQGSGLPSVAVKNCGTWKSVFVGDPGVSTELIRGICKYAGVHVWTPQGDDVVDIGSGYVTIHATKEGHRIMRLPDATGLYDVNDSRHVADEIREHRFFMRYGDTQSFCVGSAERFIGIGLPNVAPPGPGRPRFVPPPPVEREPRRDTPAPTPRNSDLETLEAVLNMDITALEGVDLDSLPDEPIDFIYTGVDSDLQETEATGEVIAGGRRRRRRGGRGRGRRGIGDPLTGPGSLPDSTTGAGEFSPPDAEADPAVISSEVSDIVEFHNAQTENYVWEDTKPSSQEQLDAESGANSEGDASL